MAFSIDTTHDKAALHPPGYGYEARIPDPLSLVIHSTNGRRGSTFEAERSFLLNSPRVSSHFLISKTGHIDQFLDPRLWAAWHAGKATLTFGNQMSIGIETHYTPGETWPSLGTEALTWLVRKLMADFSIEKGHIETHRKVALPARRKVDPSQFTDTQFYLWRDHLVPLLCLRFRARCDLLVLEAPRADAPIALGGTALIPRGSLIEIDEVRADGWAHFKNELGFVPLSYLEAV